MIGTAKSTYPGAAIATVLPLKARPELSGPIDGATLGGSVSGLGAGVPGSVGVAGVPVTGVWQAGGQHGGGGQTPPLFQTFWADADVAVAAM